MARDPAASIQVDGLRELRATLRAAGLAYDELKGAGLEAAGLVLDLARQLTPVDSGALVGTERAAGQAKGAVVRAGYASVPYAGPIHFGWPDHGIAPNPFMYDALDERRGQVVEAYQRSVDDIARRAS